MKDAYIALSRGQGQPLYALARASKAQRLVEFGASFGISAIDLGAAARDNGGRLVTTEIEPNKVTVARANLSAAGLDDVAELRAGDAMVTLAPSAGPRASRLPEARPGRAHRGALTPGRRPRVVALGA
ncbi:MAG: class I SAM-dependent methyltransferase [Polyangiaceae bacterium]